MGLRVCYAAISFSKLLEYNVVLAVILRVRNRSYRFSFEQRA